jgi:hypothetical protein
MQKVLQLWVQDELKQLVDQPVLDTPEVIDLTGAARPEQVRGPGGSTATLPSRQEHERDGTFQNSVIFRISDPQTDRENGSAFAR